MGFGSYFIGFTISQLLVGATYGFILYKNPNKEKSEINFIIRIIISNLIVLGVVNLLINSLWLNIMYGKAFIALLTARIAAEIILFPIYTVSIYFLERALRPFIKKYIYEEESAEIDED